MEKGKNLTNILLCVLIALVLIVGGMFGYKEFVDKDNNDKEPSIEQTNIKKSKEEDKSDDCKEQNIESKANTNNNSQTDVKETNTITSQTLYLSELGGSKSINGDKKAELKYNFNYYTISFTDKRTINVGIVNERLFNNHKVDLTDVHSGSIHKINNFNKDIKEVYVSVFDEKPERDTIFYLMEDGTVEYTPIMHSFNDVKSYSDINKDFYSKLKSYGPIAEVKDIVRITKVEQVTYNNNTSSSDYTCIAIKEDGTYYDLYKLLENTGYYK